ncbi:MAG TPA: hypothetical protein VG268_05205 [Streptosporangiaceae bacterium]|nr:hypothetical protein [Streptosporangiaceae bacterium]
MCRRALVAGVRGGRATPDDLSGLVGLVGRRLEFPVEPTVMAEQVGSVPPTGLAGAAGPMVPECRARRTWPMCPAVLAALLVLAGRA